MFSTTYPITANLRKDLRNPAEIGDITSHLSPQGAVSDIVCLDDIHNESVWEAFMRTHKIGGPFMYLGGHLQRAQDEYKLYG